MKILNIIGKVLFVLILAMPVIGLLGVFQAPTADLYNTEIAFNFINILMEVKYINYIMGIVSLVTIIFIITNRMAAASILILPITVNIFAFHAFLDGGLFTGGAIMGNLLILLNLYFLWLSKDKYKILLSKD